MRLSSIELLNMYVAPGPDLICSCCASDFGSNSFECKIVFGVQGLVAGGALGSALEVSHSGAGDLTTCSKEFLDLIAYLGGPSG